MYSISMRAIRSLLIGWLFLSAGIACSPSGPARTDEPEQHHTPQRTAAGVITGKVVGIADGDTVTVYDGSVQTRIRLAGIDAPESGQAFGQRSKQNLSGLIFGKTVTVTSDKIDRYGRTVGVITLDGEDVNIKQIEAGLAWHYKQYEREQTPAERAAYSDAEINARQDKLGLWSDPNPIPPWDYRASHRSR
jgi:endonuclease YncB( thermonuclease family)